MGTKGRFPGDGEGLGAWASCWSSGGLFWGGGRGRQTERVCLLKT